MNRKECFAWGGRVAAVVTAGATLARVRSAEASRTYVDYLTVELPEGMAKGSASEAVWANGDLAAVWEETKTIMFSRDLVSGAGSEEVAKAVGTVNYLYPYPTGQVVSFTDEYAVITRYLRNEKQWAEMKRKVQISAGEKTVWPLCGGDSFVLVGEKIQVVKIVGDGLAVGDVAEPDGGRNGKFITMSAVGLCGYLKEKSLWRIDPSSSNPPRVDTIPFGYENVVCSGKYGFFQEVVSEGERALVYWAFDGDSDFTINSQPIPIPDGLQLIEGSFAKGVGHFLGIMGEQLVVVRVDQQGDSEIRDLGIVDRKRLWFDSLLERTGVDGWPWVKVSVAGGPIKVLYPDSMPMKKTYMPEAGNLA